jgi:heat shock protein HslJ
MRTYGWIAIVLTALATALAGCGGPAQVAELEGSEWILGSLDGQTPLGGTQISLAFEEGTAGGFAGCNSYGGAYGVDGEALSILDIAITAQACLEPEGVMAQESVYLAALLEVVSFRVADERLELSDAAGATRLIYRRQETFAGDPADLVGSQWRLVTLDGRPWAEDMVFTLAFEADGYHGTAGCRHFEGAYQAGDGEIGFPSISMLEAECPGAGDDYYVREGRFTDSLTWARNWRIRDGRLEIHTARGEVLVFETAP